MYSQLSLSLRRRNVRPRTSNSFCQYDISLTSLSDVLFHNGQSVFSFSSSHDQQTFHHTLSKKDNYRKKSAIMNHQNQAPSMLLLHNVSCKGNFRYYGNSTPLPSSQSTATMLYDSDDENKIDVRRPIFRNDDKEHNRYESKKSQQEVHNLSWAFLKRYPRSSVAHQPQLEDMLAILGDNRDIGPIRDKDFDTTTKFQVLNQFASLGNATSLNPAKSQPDVDILSNHKSSLQIPDSHSSSLAQPTLHREKISSLLSSWDKLSDPKSSLQTRDSPSPTSVHPTSYKEEISSLLSWDKLSELSQHRNEPESDIIAGYRNGVEQAERVETHPKLAFGPLASFDPQNPPTFEDLGSLQEWLECEAHHETLSRFMKLVDDARARNDYTAMTSVQWQVFEWFHPLQEAIAKRQRSYLSKELDNGCPPEHFKGKRIYGPFLCALPPEKLAVIVSCESLCHILTKSRKNQDGVTFVSLAMRIGEAVEDEVAINRLLYKRFMQSKKELGTKDSSQFEDSFEENIANIFAIQDSKSEVIETNDDSISQNGHLVDGVNNELTTDRNTLNHNFSQRWTYASSHLKKYIDDILKFNSLKNTQSAKRVALRRARYIQEGYETWTESEKIHVGSTLIQLLLDTAVVRDEENNEESAFIYETIRKRKCQSYVRLNERLYKLCVNDKAENFSISATRYKPMIVPPKPWTHYNKGGYNILRTELLRFHGCETQKEVLQHADLKVIFDGLNALGHVPWVINKYILDIAQRCWDQNIALGDIPSQTNVVVPPEPLRPEKLSSYLEKDSEDYECYMKTKKEYWDAMHRYRRARQKNSDFHSLRCSVTLKLDQAKKFKDFDRIYFPYNMDFRGRAYPIPPHLSNVGSDLSRGLLIFAESKPLGERGFYWLKVHLANFAGMDKVPFDDRAKFVDNNINRIRASVEDPFGGERWWMSLEDPFQGLATCYEIIAAIDSGDPTTYMCSLPVHMDGSCNGLQHYAALGRDKVGGTAVNLCATDTPQDVYVDVLKEVVKRVSADAERTLEFSTDDLTNLSKEQIRALQSKNSAKLLNGLIDRGVVKRTVMTSVYGVTFIGAKNQIREKIKEKLEAQGFDIDGRDEEVFRACSYLAHVTLDTIGDIFSGAKGTMKWLSQCAGLIAKEGRPVSWISPIGLPAIQPYRQKKTANVVTLLQTVSLVHTSDDLPVHTKRQVSAFPPNFIHSLDSSHMLLTALEMNRRGLRFSAVHDSFWTHACDVDEMNSVLRTVFVDLYSQPILENLKETWETCFPELTFPDLPERGSLDLSEIKRSKYFFQ